MILPEDVSLLIFKCIWSPRAARRLFIPARRRQWSLPKEVNFLFIPPRLRGRSSDPPADVIMAWVRHLQPASFLKPLFLYSSYFHYNTEAWIFIKLTRTYLNSIKIFNGETILLVNCLFKKKNKRHHSLITDWLLIHTRNQIQFIFFCLRDLIFQCS